MTADAKLNNLLKKAGLKDAFAWAANRTVFVIVKTEAERDLLSRFIEGAKGMQLDSIQTQDYPVRNWTFAIK